MQFIFSALGSSIYSMLVSFVRQIIFLVPCAYIFSKTGNVNLVWLAWPIAEIASVALSVFFFIGVRRRSSHLWNSNGYNSER